MSNECESNNPADLAAEIIKKRAAESGLELTDDFEERIAEARAYMEEEVEADRGACDLEIDCDALRDKDARLLSRAMGGNIESRELPDGAYEHTIKETPMPQSQALRLLEYPIVEDEE